MLEQILSLPIEKKIGQLFFVGISGDELTEDSGALLQKISPGGVCLFARNIKTAAQVGKLLSDIRDISLVEPFLSLDQEGGGVDRLRRILTPMPAANLIKTVEQAEKLAEITAEILRTLGFNMNFAPVVDVAGATRSIVSNGLYSRVFGDSSEDVIKLAGAYLKILQKNGCFGCLKHFPGLGASEIDSHEDLPAVKISQTEFFEKDLSPYREIFKTGDVKAVMIAHAAFPNIDLQQSDSDGKLLPSSLSSNFIDDLLRRQMNFDGLAITDDLEMGAIVKNYGVGEASKMAIAAGADMAAICAGAENIRNGFDAVFNAVKNGKISESRIDESLRRIAHLKSGLSKPLDFNEERWQFLSDEIARLNRNLKF